MKMRVKNLNTSRITSKRVGVIVYTTIDGVVYFGMGLDNTYHELTDFGGSILWTDTDAIHGALREFHEETLGSFGTISINQVQDCPVVFDESNLIIFINVLVDLLTVGDEFRRRASLCEKPEICNLIWLTYDEFKQAIRDNKIMYERVRNFLRGVGDISYLL